ncbi:MAG: M48 family metalloprotease [Thermomicrobiales bacterium]
MDRSAPAQTMPCPSCQAILPVNPYFATWCESCNWNIKPATPPQPGDEGVFAREYAKIGKHQAEALFKSLAAQPHTMTRNSPTTYGALAFALLIHATTFGLVLLGLALIFRGWPNLLAAGLGAFSLAFAWSMRPRVIPFPRRILPRSQFPATYALADALSDRLGTYRVEAIVIEDHFNAALGHAGWRHLPVLYLGLPLWAILDDRERLALLAHELAHEANGDVGRGIAIGSAIEALAAWYGAISPPTGRVSWEYAWGDFIAVPIMKTLRLIPHAGIVLLCHLLWRDSQRAEYLADRLAARTAGTDATLGLLDKIQLGQSFELSLQRAAYGRDNEGLFDALRRRIRELPAREMERIRRVQQLTDARLDRTHPPTPYRIDLLRHQSGEATTDPGDLTLLSDAATELAALEAVFAREMIADYSG